MGMTYKELDEFGKLREIERCGPLTMFERLLVKWDHLPASEVAVKVKRFFRMYAINRHIVSGGFILQALATNI